MNFKGIKYLFFLVGTSAFLLAYQLPGWQSQFVQLKEDGALSYKADQDGNVIPDFSRVGYHFGDKEIPSVPVVKIVNAGHENDQEVIQKAIDEVSLKTPDQNGYRGAILLKDGTYKIPGTLTISKSGVVLRGEGDNKDGTRIIATGTGKRDLLRISGNGVKKEVPGTRVTILDKYVPVGSRSFNVESPKDLKVGDRIILFRPGSKTWIHDLKMDQIDARPNTRQWEPKEYDLSFERTITRIQGKMIFIDNPVMMPIEAKYGGAQLYKYTFEGRISEVGVENILFESEFTSDTDEDHGWVAVSINKTTNSWVRDITVRYFGYSAVSLGKDAKNITVTDSRCFDAKSQITGGRRYSFNNDGQLNLFMNLQTTEGRHDYVTGQAVLGPNVFYNCKSTRTHADIGPHHRWAVGTLYDNITTDGEINVQDRGNWGTGHGWSGVTQVIWNSKASGGAIQNPWVSGKNYAIGFDAKKLKGRLEGRPEAEWETSQTGELEPKSLYQAQLKARSATKGSN